MISHRLQDNSILKNTRIAFYNYLVPINIFVVIIAIAVFTIPFLQPPNSADSYFSYTRTFQFLVAVLFSVLAFITSLTLPSKKNVSRPVLLVRYSALALLATKTVSSVFALSPLHAITGSYGSWANGTIFALCSYAVLYSITSINLTKRHILVLLQAISAQSLLLSVMTITEAIANGALSQPYRPDSALLNPDYFLSYGLLILPMSLALLILTVKTSRTIILPFINMISVIALPIAMFFCLPWDLQSYVYNANHHSNIAPVVSAEQFLQNSSNSMRFTLWDFGLATGNLSPLIGVGPANSTEAFTIISSQFPDWNMKLIPNHPHNEIIEYYAEMGILGVIGYLMFFISIYNALLRGIKLRNSNDRAIIISTAIGITLYFLFNQVLFTSVVPGLFFILITSLVINLVDTRNIFNTEPRRYLFGSLIIASALSGLLFWSTRLYKAEFYLNKSAIASSLLENHESRKLAEVAKQTYAFEPEILYRASRHFSKERQLEVSAQIISLNPYYSSYLSHRANMKATRQ